MKSRILVSACLMGYNVRYNGSHKAQLMATLAALQDENRLVIHCPELAAGLPTPRPSAEIVGGSGEDVMQACASVCDDSGQDVTAHYQLAAWLALRAAQDAGCEAALLTDGSPTCGCQTIYDGTFSGHRHSGMGVAATLLSQQGIRVFSDQQLDAFLAWIEEKDRHENSL